MSTPEPRSQPVLSPATLVEASRLAFLTPGLLHFFEHGALLRMTIEGDRSYLRVTVVRAFPLSDPARYWSVRDAGGGEIGLIAEPADLSAADRALLNAQLTRRYFVPVITRIVSARERFGTVDWVMESDRGLCRFTTRNLRENVQRPAPGRIILNDVDGNRYDIPDVDALGRESQERLFHHL